MALYSQSWSIDSSDDPANWLKLFDSSCCWVLIFLSNPSSFSCYIFSSSKWWSLPETWELWENVSHCSLFLCLLITLSLFLSVSVISGNYMNMFISKLCSADFIMTTIVILINIHINIYRCNCRKLICHKKWMTGHAIMLCSYTVQVHTGNRTACAGFVCVHVRNGPTPSLGFPRTVRLHFLLLNSFFPTAPQREWSVTVLGAPVCAGEVSFRQEFTRFCFIYLFVYSIKGPCNCCNSLQFLLYPPNLYAWLCWI